MPTILVADDNSNIQKMVTLALKEAGISVVAVGNGEAAVRKLPDVKPDLVLADIFMPVKNGYEVCEFVKGDERFAHIPVVLLVGAFDPLDEHEVERVHADGVLKKPFVPPDPLIAMVTSLLEKGASTAAGSPAIAAALAASEAAPGVRLEKTQQLTAEELAAITRQAARMAPAPEPEPEPEQFGTQPEALTIDEAHAPVAFGDMLEAEEEEGAESEEAAAEEFEASSVSSHLTDELGSHPASAEPAAEEKPEDHWAGIKEEAKQPDPERPPIAVEFGESEPVEMVTDETRDLGPHLEVRPDPGLVSSANDWMSARPPAAAPEPSPTAPEPEFEPMRMEAESPAPASAFHEPAPRPLESIADDLRAEAMHAAPARDMEETQQFIAPAASAAPRVVEPEEHHEMLHEAQEAEAPPPPPLPPALTWGRVEEVMLPAVPLVAEAAAAIHAHVESAPPAAVPTTSGTGTGPDLLISAITQKVIEQLDPKMIEKLSRELVRPLIEALIRREIDKD